MGSVSFTRLFGRYDLADYTNALCADPLLDPDLWYSDEQSKMDVAARVCGHCPIQEACLAKALDMERALPDRPVGVWGGLSAAERIEMSPRSYRPDDLTDVLWGYDLFEGEE